MHDGVSVEKKFAGTSILSREDAIVAYERSIDREVFVLLLDVWREKDGEEKELRKKNLWVFNSHDILSHPTVLNLLCKGRP